VGKIKQEIVMKKLTALLLLITGIITTFLLANNSTPEGWFAAGNKPSEYEMGIDKSVFQNGHSGAFIKSKNPGNNEFGTLMQSISAENYLDKRLKLSGFIKSENVEGWCGLWMRIDGDKGEQLEFDNMFNRFIKGTTEWKEYEIILDVPSNSKVINYGVLLGGKGKVWFDNLKLKKVDKDIPLTSVVKENKLSKEPINLDFEE